jgi:hypothetical protein
MQLLDVDEGTGQLKVGVKILLVTPTLKSGGQLTPLTSQDRRLCCDWDSSCI